MKQMKKYFSIVFCLVFYLQISAQEAMKEELFTADMVLKNRTAINLSEKQVKTIREIYEAHIGKFNTKRWDLDTEQAILEKSIKKISIDETTTLSQMQKVIALENELKTIRLQMLIKIKNELSKTQQEQLKELRTEKDINTFSLITPINKNPRVVLKVDGNIGQGKTPLYILKHQGKTRKITGSYIQSLSTDTIESINVIKGETAIISYGREGRNGVVIITLKE